MGEFSEEYMRGWEAAVKGEALVLGLGENCHSQEFAAGFLAAMEHYTKR